MIYYFLPIKVPTRGQKDRPTRPSARAARVALRGAPRFAIQKSGRSNFFRAVRCARPPTYRLRFPESMRRGGKVSIEPEHLGRPSQRGERLKSAQMVSDASSPEDTFTRGGHASLRTVRLSTRVP